jgi:hypothetical protein
MDYHKQHHLLWLEPNSHCFTAANNGLLHKLYLLYCLPFLVATEQLNYLREQIHLNTIIICARSHHLLKYGLPIIFDSYVESTDYRKQHHSLTAANSDLFHKLDLLYRLPILIATEQLNYLPLRCLPTANAIMQKQPSTYHSKMQ